jgi:FkbM family methyltransferase
VGDRRGPLKPIASRLVPHLAAAARGYLHARGLPGKRAVWRHVIEPRLAERPREVRCRTEFGATLKVDTQDMIGRYVYFFGVWEPNLTAWMSRTLSPGDTFIDVGANIGYFTLLGSGLVGASGSVVAIEASPAIFAVLCENVRLNGQTNVRTVNMAVLDRPATLPFYSGPPGNAGMASVRRHPDVETYECTIGADTLPRLCTQPELSSARIVKIDVEGVECEVTEGLRDALPAMRPDVELVVEIVPDYLRAYGRRAEEVFAVFFAAGFNAYHIENDYASISYVPPRRLARPRRIQGPLDREFDAIFSRRDAAEL